ncbi:MAG: chorismate-binding protein [Gelidibacter sp.]
MILDQFFEQIETQFDAKLPFVAYKKPNTSELKAVLQPDNVLHEITDFTESGFVFAPFDSRKDAFLIPLKDATIFSVQYDQNDFYEEELRLQKAASYKINSNEHTDRLAHIKRVEKGVAAIKSDCFSKVVLSRCEVIENAETNPIKIFKRLLERYPTAFVYVWYHPEVGLWLGATPETLLSVNGNQLNTMALAGTQAYEGSVDVVWKEKEKEEQQIVTDFIVNSLESVDSIQSALGSSQLARNEKTPLDGATIETQQTYNNALKVSGPKTVKAGNLLHLLTEISMRLKPEARNLKAILDALHPTPAVCGFPKEKAKAYIIENEGYFREFYAGFMGELNMKETTSRNTNRRNVENNAYRVQKSISNLYVNLRCMQIKNKNILIYVGGGITKDSDAELEWEETVHKSKIIKSVL